MQPPPWTADCSIHSVNAVKTLEAYVLTAGKWTLLATLKENDSVRLPPFDAIAFPLDALWP